MNIDFLKGRLNGLYTMDFFAGWYIACRDLNELYSEVRGYIYVDCPEISRLARDLYNGLLLNTLSKIGYLDFSDFATKKRKVDLLAANGIIDIDDDDRLLSLLKGLGEEKVLKTLCNLASSDNLQVKRGLKVGY